MYDEFYDTDGLNSAFKMEEIWKAINNLKNNKSCGHDLLISEYFKCSKDVILHLITDLFNLILQKCIVPNEWGIGIIKPIYKNKGDRSNPEVYRGITLLSCLGKLFTAVLNKRLPIIWKTMTLLARNKQDSAKIITQLTIYLSLKV